MPCDEAFAIAQVGTRELQQAPLCSRLRCTGALFWSLGCAIVRAGSVELPRAGQGLGDGFLTVGVTIGKVRLIPLLAVKVRLPEQQINASWIGVAPER